MNTLVIATGNAHKVAEICSNLGPRFRYFSLRDFPGAPTPDETGDTFGENAKIKAASLAQWCLTAGLDDPLSTYILADDSGLEVQTLGWAPGIYSARFAGLDSGRAGNSSDRANNEKLLRLLANCPDEQRTARFRCVLCWHPVSTGGNGTHELQSIRWFQGRCTGRIQKDESGIGGFGYDPLFVPEGYDRSFAELGDSTKNLLSHRAKALSEMSGWLDQHLDKEI